MKKCTKCGIEKEYSEFSKCKNYKDGFAYNCKSCIKIYYQKNKDERRIYYNKNKEEIILKAKKYHKENKEMIAFKNKKYRSENKEDIALQKKKYNDENRDELTLKKIKYQSNRRKADPAFKILTNLRNRTREALKSSGAKKCGKEIELIGCSHIHLKEHLEKQFKKGMTWDNYGLFGWNIDHRLPCSSFDMMNPEEQKACFHYTNLQPLWAEDNLKKSDNLDYLI